MTFQKKEIINVVLFIATFFSTWFAGGLSYMVCIMTILISHEAGHYFFAKKHKIDASKPYFIPFPFNIFGTFGAVIVMKKRIKTAAALIEIGSSGPLSGMAVAVPVLVVGLLLSEVGEIPQGSLLEGQSLLYLIIKSMTLPSIPPGHDVNLHPVAFAGWTGLLLTMINLIPIGQLDGGHVFYAMWGKRHKLFSKLFFFGLFVLGVLVSVFLYYKSTSMNLTGDSLIYSIMPGASWIFFGAVLGILGRRGLKHPPIDDFKLSFKHKLAGYACMIIFILTFTPIPMQLYFPG